MKMINRNAISRIIIAAAITLLAIFCFYKLEVRFSYSRLEEYLLDHSIAEDISFSYTKDVAIKLNETADPALYRACFPKAGSKEPYRILFSHFKTLVIGNNTYRNGDYLVNLELLNDGEPQALRIYAVGGELLYDGWIEFMFLDNTPTMHITTSENDMDIVNNTETGEVKPHVDSWIRLLDGEGKQEILTDAEVFRHGNSTFDNYDPKSYNITLNSPESMLGMTSGRKWVLKANAMDNTQLIRNEMACRSSDMMGLYPCPESRYVNLFVNGKYYGLYLLTQRISGEEMADLVENEYLLEMDYRYEREPHYFTVDDIGIVVHYPENVTEEEIARIRERFIEARDAVRRRSGYDEYIDIDSFAKMYLVQDYYVQADVDFSSFYFTLKNDGRFHAGPVWDFDLSCGMTSSLPYHEELASRARLFNAPDKRCIFLADLSKDEDFLGRVWDIYNSGLQKDMSDYMKTGWDRDISKISRSMEVNKIVNGISDKGRETLDSADSLKNWIEKRNRYLISYYNDPDAYADVTFHFAWGKMTAGVRKGEPLGFIPDDAHPGNDDAFWGEITGFIDSSGANVDENYTVTSDKELFAVYTDDSYAWEEYSLPL